MVSLNILKHFRISIHPNHLDYKISTIKDKIALTFAIMSAYPHLTDDDDDVP